MNKMTLFFILISFVLACYGTKVYAENKDSLNITEKTVDMPDSLLKEEIKAIQAANTTLKQEVSKITSDLSTLRFLFIVCILAILILSLLVILAFLKIADKASKKRLSENLDKLNIKIDKTREELRGNKGQSVPTFNGTTQDVIENPVEINSWEILRDKHRRFVLQITFKGVSQPYAKIISEREAKMANQNQNRLKEIIEKYFKNEIEQIRARKIQDDSTYAPPREQTEEIDTPSQDSFQKEDDKPGKNQVIKELYMANNEGDMFIGFSDSPKDDSTFLIKYKPDDPSNQGELHAIGSVGVLRVIKTESRDESLKIVGNSCPWKEAKEYEQVQAGLVVKKNDVWKIINPVEIILRK